MDDPPRRTDSSPRRADGPPQRTGNLPRGRKGRPIHWKARPKRRESRPATGTASARGRTDTVSGRTLRSVRRALRPAGGSPPTWGGPSTSRDGPSPRGGGCSLTIWKGRRPLGPRTPPSRRDPPTCSRRRDCAGGALEVPAPNTVRPRVTLFSPGESRSIRRSPPTQRLRSLGLWYPDFMSSTEASPLSAR